MRARSLRGPVLVVAALAVVTSGLTGCGSSGRELREPEPGATAPPRKAAPAGTIPTSTAGALDVFGLATTAWSPGGRIPARFTCDGDEVSPPLALFSPPAGTTELALVVTDLDNDFVHWVVAGIAPATTAFGEGELPEGAREAANSAGSTGWVGPCPPPGEEHIYEFALYALTAPPAIPEGADAESAVAAISAAPIETATITGSYDRP